MVTDPREKKKEETAREDFKGGMILVQFNDARLFLKKNIYLCIYLSGICNESI
jgi:hypothetical protein